MAFQRDINDPGPDAAEYTATARRTYPQASVVQPVRGHVEGLEHIDGWYSEESAYCEVAFIGDSIVTNENNRIIRTVMADLEAAGMQFGGPGFRGLWQDENPPELADLLPGDWPWGAGPASGSSDDKAPFGHAENTQSGLAAKLWTRPAYWKGEPIRYIDVFYVDTTAGATVDAFQLMYDGDSGNPTTHQLVKLGDHKLKRVRCVVPENHRNFSTVQLTHIIFQPSFQLAGFAFYGDRGLVLHCVTRGGMDTGNVIPDVPGSSDRLQILDVLKPKLTVVQLLMNDSLQANTTLADYTSRLTTIVQRAKQYGKVLLLAPQNQDPNNVFINTLGNSQADYEDAMRTIAEANECAFISIAQEWGTFAEASAKGLINDAWHPNGHGMTETGHTVARALLASGF